MSRDLEKFQTCFLIDFYRTRILHLSECVTFFYLCDGLTFWLRFTLLPLFLSFSHSICLLFIHLRFLPPQDWIFSHAPIYWGTRNSWFLLIWKLQIEIHQLSSKLTWRTFWKIFKGENVRKEIFILRKTKISKIRARKVTKIDRSWIDLIR